MTPSVTGKTAREILAKLIIEMKTIPMFKNMTVVARLPQGLWALPDLEAVAVSIPTETMVTNEPQFTQLHRPAAALSNGVLTVACKAVEQANAAVEMYDRLEELGDSAFTVVSHNLDPNEGGNACRILAGGTPHKEYLYYQDFQGGAGPALLLWHFEVKYISRISYIPPDGPE